MTSQNSLNILGSVRISFLPSAVEGLVERDGELRPEFERRYHTSGHASRGDLEWTIGEIGPVHTTGQGWFRERFENVVVLEEGKAIRCK